MGVDVVVAGIAIFSLPDNVGEFTEFMQSNAFVPEGLSFAGREALPGLNLFANQMEQGSGSMHHGVFSKVGRVLRWTH